MRSKERGILRSKERGILRQSFVGGGMGRERVSADSECKW